MRPATVVLRTVLAVTLAGTLLGTAGCSSEDPPYDDGGQSVPLAGLGSDIESAGVEVVSTDTPAGATTAEVEAALTEARVVDPVSTTPDDTANDEVTAFDPTATAGLLGLVTDTSESTLVLVFSSADAAAVFAAGDPEVFAEQATEDGRRAFLSGNLVGYAAPERRRPARLQAALQDLGGASS